jgi:hypothetical protein
LQRFCRDLARASNVAGFFRTRVDLDKYVDYLAVSVLIQNWDAYNKNHFILYDGQGSKKWFVVPWDLDRTLGDHWSWGFDEARLPIELGTRQRPGVTGWNRMWDRFYSDPELRSQLLRRLRELLENEFTAAKLFRSSTNWRRVLKLPRRRIGGAGRDRCRICGPGSHSSNGISSADGPISWRQTR